MNLENKYRLYKNQLDKTLKESKSIHFKKITEANKLNLRNTWDEIKTIKRQTALNKGKGIINENNKIAKKLNNHFINIVESIANEIPEAKKNFSVYLKNQVEQPFLSIPQHLTELSLKSNI